MGEFSVKGSALFDARIRTDMEQIVAAVQAHPDAPAFRSLVLMGGYGRGEGTPYIKDGLELPFNDYDLIVVGESAGRKTRKEIQGRLHCLEKRLSEQLQLPVDLYYHTVNTLGGAECSLMNVEMKLGHRVLWGDFKLSQWMPPFGVDDIPLSEGTRLLLNRGTLLLMLRKQHASMSHLEGEERLEAIKYLAKAYLAMGDCLLMAHGDYSVSYVEKRDTIRRWHEDPRFTWIVEQYWDAIDFREWGDPLRYQGIDLEERWQECREEFLRFFLWFEGRRLGMEMHSIEDYFVALTLSTRQVESLAKSMALNLMLLGTHSVSPGLRWLWKHPRYRLYCVLLCLLSDGSHTLARRLLPCEEDLIDHFFALRERLA
jgi:hypothetical protein